MCVTDSQSFPFLKLLLKRKITAGALNFTSQIHTIFHKLNKGHCNYDKYD